MGTTGNKILISLAVIVLAIVLGGTWAYNNFDEEAEEGWSRDFRVWWYTYLDSREERITLAPDDMELEPEFTDEENLTIDWFTKKSPAWSVALEEFKGKPNLRYLEVGAYEGRSVMWMFKNILTHPTARATVIDIFYDLGIDEYNTDLRNRYEANLATVGATDQVETIVNFSQIALRDLPLNTYDIVYIDGSHWAPDVLEDAVLAMRLLKEGGIMIFDDYRWWVGLPKMQRTKTGIDTFIEFYGDQFEVLHNTKQVIMRKTGTDFVGKGINMGDEAA